MYQVLFWEVYKNEIISYKAPYNLWIIKLLFSSNCESRVISDSRQKSKQTKCRSWPLPLLLQTNRKSHLSSADHLQHPPGPSHISSWSYRSSLLTPLLLMLCPASNPSTHSLGNQQVLTKEASRLTVDPHLSLRSPKSNPKSHPQICSRPSAAASPHSAPIPRPLSRSWWNPAVSFSVVYAHPCVSSQYLETYFTCTLQWPHLSGS